VATQWRDVVPISLTFTFSISSITDGRFGGSVPDPVVYEKESVMEPSYLRTWIGYITHYVPRFPIWTVAKSATVDPAANSSSGWEKHMFP